jgi:ribonuclease HI
VQLYPENPPYQEISTDIALGLTFHIDKKNDDPVSMKATALEFIELYAKDRLRVFTDASRTQEDRVAVGIFIPERDIRVSYRVTDGVSICAGELMAIHTALQLLEKENLLNTKLIILSDSLSALKIIENQSGSFPTLLNKINKLLLQADNITLAWIPSHVGLGGNEEADGLAKKGTEHTTIDMEMPVELADVYNEIRHYTDQKWQVAWDNCTTNTLNKEINPKVSRHIKFIHKNRRTETLITRFRLGKTINNHYLYQINQHPTGLCAVCNVKDDIKHTLFECRTKLVEKLHEYCTDHGVPISFGAVFNDPGTVAIITRYFKNKNDKGQTNAQIGRITP